MRFLSFSDVMALYPDISYGRRFGRATGYPEIEELL
jgi:hypothetical protein